MGVRGDTARRGRVALSAGPTRGRASTWEGEAPQGAVPAPRPTGRLHHVMTLGVATGSEKDGGDGPQMQSGPGVRPQRARGPGGPLRTPPAIALSKSPAFRAPALGSQTSSARLRAAPCSPFPLYFLKTSTCANPTCSEAHLARPGGARGSASGFRGSDSAATVLCGAWSPGPRFPPLRDPAWTSVPDCVGSPLPACARVAPEVSRCVGGEGYPVNICLSFYELHECSLYEVLPLLPTFSLHYVFIAIINYL